MASSCSAVSRVPIRLIPVSLSRRAGRRQVRSTQLTSSLLSPWCLSTTPSSSSDSSPPNSISKILTPSNFLMTSLSGMLDLFFAVAVRRAQVHSPGASPTSLHSWQTSTTDFRSAGASRSKICLITSGGSTVLIRLGAMLECVDPIMEEGFRPASSSAGRGTTGITSPNFTVISRQKSYHRRVRRKGPSSMLVN